MVALVCSCLFLLLVVAYSIRGVIVSCLLSLVECYGLHGMSCVECFIVACYAVYFIACFLYVQGTRFILTVHAFYCCFGIIKGLVLYCVL